MTPGPPGDETEGAPRPGAIDAHRSDATASAPPAPAPVGGGSRWVALGILLSRISGLVRQKAFNYFLAVSAHGDVAVMALRGGNLIQNLLGEQALSASFIPVYSRLLAEGRRDEARRFASAVLGLLLATVAVLVTLGFVFAPALVSFFSAGYLADAAEVAAGTRSVDRFPLAVRAIRVTLPMAGVLALSAWSLAVLNSHRRFLLPYVAPALWNAAIVGALLGAGWHSGYLAIPADAPLPVLDRWVLAFCLGGLVGGVLQFAIQAPAVVRCLGELRPRWAPRTEGVGAAVRLFGPALAGRGVAQLSAFLDLLIASFLVDGAQSAVNSAMLLALLPFAVFGSSVANAELPELSEMDAEKAAREAPERIRRALRRSWFLVAPSAVGLLVFGRLVVELLYGGGKFGADDALLVTLVLAAYALGILASASSRLLQNSFFALRDSGTPARIAVLRLVVSAGLGVVLAFALDRVSVAEVPLPSALGAAPGSGLHLGAVGLALASAVAAWVELGSLFSRLRRSLPDLRFPLAAFAQRLGAAALWALPGILAWGLIGGTGAATALLVLPIYPALYLGRAFLHRSEELAEWTGRRG